LLGLSHVYGRGYEITLQGLPRTGERKGGKEA
jgi:hypothetical protein